jgi:hypothetical protein
MFMRLKVVEGVTFTMRFDALETIWGKDQALFTTPPVTTTGAANPSAGDMRDYNTSSISFEQTYVDFDTAIGQFRVGYRGGTPYGWGTPFMNSPGTAPGFGWKNTFGNLTVLADANKTLKGDFNNASQATLQTDVDRDYYDLGATYKYKGGEAGLLWTYFRYADNRNTGATAPDGTAVSASNRYYSLAINNLQPYVKTKLGPVNFEAEGYWQFGKYREYDAPTTRTDVDASAKGLYVNAKYNMGPAYVGGIFLYASGDYPTTPTKREGAINLGGGTDTDIWGSITPAIMFGDDYHDYLVTEGNLTSGAPVTRTENLRMYQIYGGYAVTKKLGLNVKFSLMKADKIATTFVSNDYGRELDIKGTYKIYDKLTYNVGAAYLWTGDYFKGTSANNKVDNNYYLSHWIDLRF